MKLASIYIEKLGYLFESPQIVNFGTKYFYSFTKEDDNIIVTRNLNSNYIDGFFDLTKLNSKLTNINAVVGQNGAGKSTLLDIIRSKFIANKNALPQTRTLFLVELDHIEEPIILRNDFTKVYLNERGKTKVELKKSEDRVQTIYYSPHYDYKYNPIFDEVDNHDVSFDKILEQDLSELTEKKSNENNYTYSASQELLFKNSLRQITFLSSDLIKTHDIFRNLFQLQEHYEPILYFRSYSLDQNNDWNKPYTLRSILKSIYIKSQTELSDWIKIRKYDKENKITNQVEVNQYILKREIIQCVISLLDRLMERYNTYLFEGYFPENLQAELSNSDAYQSILLFSEHSTISRQNKSTKILRNGVLKKLLVKLYEVIEKTTNEVDVSNRTLKTSTVDAIEILKLQRQFLNELNIYYYKFHDKKNLVIDDSDKIGEFINYMPFSRRMSSGETALLNFYSRIYDFLNSNLKEVKSRQLKDHYVLLLDEADLSFHLSWKKRYVKALLKTLPYFFNELNNKPSIEIIFTTHDPISLSDLPNTNVIYLERRSYDSLSNILKREDKSRPMKTFGANISDLIADSFFIEKSLIGDFVFDKIRETVEWLNKKEDQQNAEYHRKLINLIDEPIVQRKLAEMYDDKMQTNFQVAVIDEQIKKLNDLRNKLNN